MRLTRHAKNYLRRIDATAGDAELVVKRPIKVDRDGRGRPRYTGEIRGVRVVVALDEPDLIVTIHSRRN